MYPDVSSWFDFRIGQEAISSCVGTTNDGLTLYIGDNFGLIWNGSYRNLYYDGATWDRLEGVGTVTYPSATTLTISPSPAWGVDEFTGIKITLYDKDSCKPFFESKITTNTDDTLTFNSNNNVPLTTDPCISIGGYLTYFATTNFSRNLIGRNRPNRIDAIFSTRNFTDEMFFFTNYDFMLPFNYTNNYFNDPLLSSLSGACDLYPIAVGMTTALYGLAIYGLSTYSWADYNFVSLLLKNIYLFKTISWGCVTRTSGQSFSYLGATMYFQPKGDMP
jgi:hypothetical protein